MHSQRTWHHDGRAEHDLLILCKEVVWVTVQHEPADGLQGEDVLRPGLGDVQRVEVEPAQRSV